ncbi:unnamed protein product [Camellia sinensis]
MQTFFLFWASANVMLSPKGVNFEVQALMGIRASLVDPHGVLDNWDGDSVDPCSWAMVACSVENLVIGLRTSQVRRKRKFQSLSIAHRHSSRSHTVALLHTGPASGNHPHQHQAKLLSDAGGGKGEPLNKIRRYCWL